MYGRLAQEPILKTIKSLCIKVRENVVFLISWIQIDISIILLPKPTVRMRSLLHDKSTFE